MPLLGARRMTRAEAIEQAIAGTFGDPRIAAERAYDAALIAGLQRAEKILEDAADAALTASKKRGAAFSDTANRADKFAELIRAEIALRKGAKGK